MISQIHKMTTCLAKWCLHHPGSEKSAYFSWGKFLDYYLINKETKNFGGKKWNLDFLEESQKIISYKSQSVPPGCAIL